jgi:aspartate carbamoyltransferase catalytic subunit
LETVFRETVAMKEVLGREVKKVPALRGKIIATLFLEPSTRTRVSFEVAAKLLSADVVNLATEGSSIEKGESLLDTALTLQATGVDILIVRHRQAGTPYLMARRMTSTAIVNAGDGVHAHPTQALLDLQTIRGRKGRVEGLRVVLVGDIAHSRVARSNLWGLTRAGAQVVLCGPPTLLPWDLLEGRGENADHPFASVQVDTELDRAIEGADVVMALRLQKERQESGLLPSLREYVSSWQVNEARMCRARPDALLMHPGPLNEGVEVSSGVAHGSQSAVEEQVTNGLAVRMAVLRLLLTQTER